MRGIPLRLPNIVVSSTGSATLEVAVHAVRDRPLGHLRRLPSAPGRVGDRRGADRRDLSPPRRGGYGGAVPGAPPAATAAVALRTRGQAPPPPRVEGARPP